ncbi:MAG: hypothetical protein ACRCX2_05945 [Paraclostridium sp.]
MGRSKSWSKEEEDFLQDNWGCMSVKGISMSLGRSINAINIKKNKMKLGSFMENGDYISFSQVVKCLGLGFTYKKTSWIKNRKFPVKNKLVNNNRFQIVYLDDFWKWAEDNKHFINFSKFEKGMLGKEPDWVDKKRRIDIQTEQRYKKTPWTDKEDEYLIFLLKEQKYSYKEVSELMQRTVGAVERRMVDLGLKERPEKAENHIEWTNKEKELVREMILDGFNYELISESVGKSSKALRGLLYRQYKTESLEKVYKIIRSEL